MIREPIVAGQFYPSSPSSLEAQISKFIDKKVPKEETIGVVSPHAGYVYSGSVAGAVMSRIKFKDTFVIMGPNHTGYGKRYSIMSEGTWKTPLGSIEIDSKLGKQILAESKNLEEDQIAHLYEHSVEVQIPFLQYLNKDFKIVPIVLSHGPRAVYKEIGKAIAKAIKDLKAETVIIASSDMTHYESQESAKKKDTQAINAILELNEDELLNRIEKLNISMCGYAPAVCLISAARELGATRAELVKYQTSGDVTGDYSGVVGYAGIIVKS
jgi:AmmeMemoRadiSam system protein B